MLWMVQIEASNLVQVWTETTDNIFVQCEFDSVVPLVYLHTTICFSLLSLSISHIKTSNIRYLFTNCIYAATYERVERKSISYVFRPTPYPCVRCADEVFDCLVVVAAMYARSGRSTYVGSNDQTHSRQVYIFIFFFLYQKRFKLCLYVNDLLYLICYASVCVLLY